MKYIFESGLWEKDFLLNDLLPEGDIEYVNSKDLNNIETKCDVFVFSCRVHDFVSIKNTVQKINPKIIIMLSDEFHQENKSIYNQLGNECELFLRQYHHPNYTYTQNTIHIPLGYTNGCKIFKENKNFTWSFCGEKKSDRYEMLNNFFIFKPYIIGNSLKKDVMCKIYSKSIFVPCGRGNSSLDCFRLYEASMNGAIPIIVGSKEEIESTFKYEEQPPWIFADTWENATQKCNFMLEYCIDNSFVVEWWKNRIQKIKNKILEVL